jgi:hypothetical protein
MLDVLPNCAVEIHAWWRKKFVVSMQALQHRSISAPFAAPRRAEGELMASAHADFSAVHATRDAVAVTDDEDTCASAIMSIDLCRMRSFSSDERAKSSLISQFTSRDAHVYLIFARMSNIKWHAQARTFLGSPAKCRCARRQRLSAIA